MSPSHSFLPSPFLFLHFVSSHLQFEFVFLKSHWSLILTLLQFLSPMFLVSGGFMCFPANFDANENPLRLGNFCSFPSLSVLDFWEIKFLGFGWFLCFSRRPALSRSHSFVSLKILTLSCFFSVSSHSSNDGRKSLVV